jgi:hypothetical protein
LQVTRMTAKYSGAVTTEMQCTYSTTQNNGQIQDWQNNVM